MQIGDYQISILLTDRFKLDGGAMFGSIPKVLWQRSIQSDSNNRIQLGCRSLILQSNTRFILIDLGMGRKWAEKERSIFCIENLLPGELNQIFPNITDLILTHLHFDHAGGGTYLDSSAELHLTFPSAVTYLQESNWHRSKNPGIREKASYLPENVFPLNQAKLYFCQDKEEILPNIKVFTADGHTQGLQWVLISDDKNTVAYPADLIPTSHHIPVPYVMGYDLHAETTIFEKTQFLTQAVAGNWIVVFEHDVEIAAGTVIQDKSGKFKLGNECELPAYRF